MDYKLLLDTAVMAGELMLANGAGELTGWEDTMHRDAFPVGTEDPPRLS